MAYIGGGVLLLRGDDGSAALGGVESALAFDGRLALGSAGSADFAANLGGGFPVVHDCSCDVCLWCGAGCVVGDVVSRSGGCS